MYNNSCTQLITSIHEEMQIFLMNPKLKITNGEFWNTKKLIIGISKIYIKLKKLNKMVFARKDYQQTKSRILLKKPVLKIKKKRN